MKVVQTICLNYLRYYLSMVAFLLTPNLSDPAFSQECEGLPSTRLDVNITGRIPKIIESLSNQYAFPITIEEDYSYYSTPGSPLTLCDGVGYGTIKAKNITLCEALYILVREVDPRYTWRLWRGKVINVFPWRLQFDPDYIMNKHLGDIHVNSMGINGIITTINNKLLRENLFISLYKPDSIICSGGPESFQRCEMLAKKYRSFLSKPRNINLSGSLRDIFNMMIISFGREYLWLLESRYTMGGQKFKFCMPESNFIYEISFSNHSNRYPSFSLPAPERRNSMLSGGFQKLIKDNTVKTSNKSCQHIASRERYWVAIKNVPLEIAAAILASKYKLPIHFESVMWFRRRTANHPSNHISIEGNFTVDEVLDEITGQDGRYTWQWWECRAINVYPKYEDRDPYYIMNLTASKLDLSNMNIKEALEKITEQVRDHYRILEVKEIETVKGGKISNLYGWPGKPRSIIFDGETVREILNDLFSQLDDGFSWQYHRWIVVPEVEDREKWWCGMEAHSELVPVLPEMERAE